MEDELLCDAWLAISADFIGRRRRGLFWQRVHGSFHARKYFAPYDMHIIHERNVKPLAYRWYTIKNSVKFCGEVDRMEAIMSPLHAATMEIVIFCFFLLNFSSDSFIHSMLLYALCTLYALP